MAIGLLICLQVDHRVEARIFRYETKSFPCLERYQLQYTSGEFTTRQRLFTRQSKAICV